jgi:CRISPR-associated protein Cas1
MYGTETGQESDLIPLSALQHYLLTAYQERKKDEIEHPFLGEKAPLGLLPHLQAMLLARTLRGDLDAYPPLIWK